MLGPGAAAHTVIAFSWFGWVVIAFCVGTAFLTRNVPRRAWSGEHTFLTRRDPPSGWPWGAPIWRGYVRLLAILPGLWWFTLLLAVVGRVTPRPSATASIWLVLAVAWLLISFILLPSIVLFARPQRLVPPAVRGQPGAIAEWSASRRARASEPER